MKKLMALVLVLFFVLGMVGCNQPQQQVQGNQLLAEGVVKNVNVSSLPKGNNYSFSEDKAQAIIDYLSNLNLDSQFEENPDEYVGRTWVISLEYDNGDVLTVYHFGMFICSEKSSWYKMTYDEASHFDKLLNELKLPNTEETNPKVNSPTESTPNNTENTNISPEAIFNIDHIKRITFYAYYGQGKGSDVPDENMTEIINWLGTFSVDKKADEILPPGSNTYYVEIEYLDGTIVKEGLDVIQVDGISYYVKSDPTPDCFLKIISKTSR